MINFSSLTMCYDPFPMGRITNVFEPEVYRLLSESFPPIELGDFLNNASRYGNKAFLASNSVEQEKRFENFIASSAIWAKFAFYVTYGDFAVQFHKLLKFPHGEYYSRFEFSWLPCDTGVITPHTDVPIKVAALVLPMPLPGEWDCSWGGETDMLRPVDKDLTSSDDYNYPQDAFETVLSCPYEPNVGNVLIKTSRSWHAVRCNGPYNGPLRKSLTLNLCKIPE